MFCLEAAGTARASTHSVTARTCSRRAHNCDHLARVCSAVYVLQDDLLRHLARLLLHAHMVLIALHRACVAARTSVVETLKPRFFHVRCIGLWPFNDDRSRGDT